MPRGARLRTKPVLRSGTITGLKVTFQDAWPVSCSWVTCDGQSVFCGGTFVLIVSAPLLWPVIVTAARIAGNLAAAPAGASIAPDARAATSSGLFMKLRTRVRAKLTRIARRR